MLFCLSIVVALCCGIVEILELEHGYWILLISNLLFVNQTIQQQKCG